MKEKVCRGLYFMSTTDTDKNFVEETLERMNLTAEVKYHGLVNQGATCYLNSVLQVLFMTKDFREAMERHKTENHDTGCIDHDLKTLFDDLKTKAGDTCDIIKKLGINRVYEQRDAAEYFEKILNLTSPEASKIFHGQLTNKNVCSVCGTETDTDEAFWHLPLALVNSDSEPYSVLDGIEEYFRASDFNGEKQMYCDQCDDKSDATTKCVIKHHPDVLMLLLKRFEFNYGYMTYVKNYRIVDVPCTLQIPENQTYELYAVVEHIGDLRSGHYTAAIKDDESWYNFNDTTVTLLDQPFQVDNFRKSDSVYLLFYRRIERAADTCTQDLRETPAGFMPADSDTCDPRKDTLQTEEVEGTVEVGEKTVVTAFINTNEETGTKDRVGSRGVGLSPDLYSNVEDQDKDVYTREIKPYNHQDRNYLSFRQDSHSETQRDEGKLEDKKDMEENAEAAKIETLSGETHLEESVEVQDSDSGRQQTPEISHDFKPDASVRYAVHLNKQDEMRDAENTVMDVKTDEERKEKTRESLTKYLCSDTEYRDTEGLEDVHQNISEALGATQGAGRDYVLKSVSVDKQGDEERKERDIKADKKVKARERGMVSGSGRLLTKYNLCRQEGSRRDNRYEQLREEKRKVKGDEEQKRGDDKHEQRREMSGRQQDFGERRSDDVRQSRSEQKISVSHERQKNDYEETQKKEHEKKGENRTNSSPRRGEKTRQGNSESNEDRVKRRCGSKKSAPTYIITDVEIKDGSQRITETKYVTPQRTSQDSIKSCVENSGGNAGRKSNQKRDANISLSERVCNLTLNERETKRQRTKTAIANVHQVSETKRTVHSSAKNMQEVSDSQERVVGREHLMEKIAEIEMKWQHPSASQKQHRKGKKKQNKKVSGSPLTRKKQKNADQTTESDYYLRISKIHSLTKKKQKVSGTREQGAGGEHVIEKRADKKKKWLRLRLLLVKARKMQIRLQSRIKAPMK